LGILIAIRRRALMWGVLAAAVVTLLAGACAGEAEATSTPAPTATAAPTATPEPLPTATAAPTATPEPLPTATPAPTATVAPTATATPDPWASVPGIVDPTNHGWPRTVEMANATLVIESPPMEILSLSLGHDEILLGLIGTDRLVGVAAPTAMEDYSNVASQVQDLTAVVGDAELVIGLEPDLVIVSMFTAQDLEDAIEAAGIPVARTALEGSIDGQERNIRLLGYLVGAEDAAEALVAEVRSRIGAVQERVAGVPEAERPRVLTASRWADSIWVAGAGSTEGDIVTAAGGVNVAAEAGVESNQIVSKESILAMAPEVIIVTQPGEGGAEFVQDLLADPAMVAVPAVRDRRVFLGDGKMYTTLSHWNVRGIEETARLLYPDLFEGVEFAQSIPAAAGS